MLRLAFFLLCCAVSTLLGAAPSSAQENFSQKGGVPHMADMWHLGEQYTLSPNAGLGDYGYMHDHFHMDFYMNLKRTNGDSCCSGAECRPTEPLKEALPELKAQGYDYMVKVDGTWYPIKLADKQIVFTKEQRRRMKESSLYGEFFTYTHVCASKASLWSWDGDLGKDQGSQLQSKPPAPTIYCIVVGGDKT